MRAVSEPLLAALLCTMSPVNVLISAMHAVQASDVGSLQAALNILECHVSAVFPLAESYSVLDKNAGCAMTRCPSWACGWRTRPDGTSICKFMSPAEQAEVRGIAMLSRTAWVNALPRWPTQRVPAAQMSMQSLGKIDWLAVCRTAAVLARGRVKKVDWCHNQAWRVLAQARASEAAEAAKEAKKAREKAEWEAARLQKEAANLDALQARWASMSGAAFAGYPPPWPVLLLCPIPEPLALHLRQTRTAANSPGCTSPRPLHAMPRPVVQQMSFAGSACLIRWNSLCHLQSSSKGFPATLRLRDGGITLRMSACRAQGEPGKEKEAKGDAKEVWKLLKVFKVLPGDAQLNARDRELAQQIAAGERQMNPKSAADVSAKWAALQRCAGRCHTQAIAAAPSASVMRAGCMQCCQVCRCGKVACIQQNGWGAARRPTGRPEAKRKRTLWRRWGVRCPRRPTGSLASSCQACWHGAGRCGRRLTLRGASLDATPPAGMQEQRKR